MIVRPLAGRQWVEVHDPADDTWLAEALRALARLGVQPRTTPSASPSRSDRPEMIPGEPTGILPLGDRPPRHNLPVELTSFVGREKELAAIRRLLGTGRLVTLTGTGGCGKTRLALQIGHGLVDAYRDGVWLVELAPLSDPALIPQTVLAALGVPEVPGQAATATLVTFLRKRSILLILDNCEHLVEACARLAETLLRAGPEMRILATSRELLGLPGELAWRVPSLSAPSDTARPTAASLNGSEAVQLFVERAVAVSPGFALTDDNAPSTAQIVRRLDGIPLAIELAAARVRVLTVEQIAARLDDRFRLLTGGSRTALRRQQTLRALIDWSHDLLSAKERTLLRRLAVFAGDWSLEAAEAVCTGAGVEKDDVLDLLTGLVDKSLVGCEEQGGEKRYRFLETVRVYAGEKLVEAGEAQLLRDRHVDWCLALAERAEPEMFGPASRTWLDRLERNHDNLRAAVRWAIERADAELGMRLAACLSFFWYYRGHFSEGRTLRAAVLALPAGPDLAALRAELLQGNGMLALLQGDYAAARAYLEEGLAIARQVGDPRLLALTLATLGFVARVQDDYAASRQALEEGLALARAGGDTVITAMSLHHLGLLALEADRDLDAGWLLNEQSAALYREIGNRRMIGNVLAGMGRVARARGNVDEARGLLAEALPAFGDVGDVGPIPMALYTLAALESDLGHLERAVRLLAAATKLEEMIGARSWPVILRERDGWLGPTRAALGKATFARAWAEGAVMTREQAIAYALEEVNT